MALPLSPLAVHEAAEALLNCVCEAVDRLPVEVPSLAGCPCRVGVVPGEPAADGCDGGCSVPAGEWPGQLTVNVVRLYASDLTQFPREATADVRDLRNCALPQVTALELAVTMWRCSPGPSEDGCPPSMADLNTAAVQFHADMLAVQQGILCCYSGTDTSNRRGRRYVMGQTLTLGPQGGCVGFTTRITVALDGCVPCPPAVPLKTAQGV